MHTPITTLKSAARDAESTTVVDVVRKLFNLRSERPAEPESPPDPSAPPPSAPAPRQEQVAMTASASPARANQDQK
jgi:hypothetical protein